MARRAVDDGWDTSRVSRTTPRYSAGRLLVATPQVQDDTFRRTVVLMLHHDDEGAQGVILNRPLDAGVDAVLPGWGAVVTAPDSVFLGGPVEQDSALGVVSVPGDAHNALGTRMLFGGLGLVDLDAPPPVVAAEIAGMRVFAGYAGWSAGQLEREIGRGDWFVVDAEARDAFSEHPGSLWREVLRRQRGRLALVASYPDDPLLN